MRALKGVRAPGFVVKERRLPLGAAMAESAIHGLAGMGELSRMHVHMTSGTLHWRRVEIDLRDRSSLALRFVAAVASDFDMRAREWK